MGTPNWNGHIVYDSGDGLTADLTYTPLSASAPHTITGVTVTRQNGCKWSHFDIGRTDGSLYITPTIPVGTTTLTQGQINAAGFTYFEDISEYTAE